MNDDLQELGKVSTPRAKQREKVTLSDPPSSAHSQKRAACPVSHSMSPTWRGPSMPSLAVTKSSSWLRSSGSVCTGPSFARSSKSAEMAVWSCREARLWNYLTCRTCTIMRTKVLRLLDNCLAPLWVSEASCYS
jgi:hypothetical protein